MTSTSQTLSTAQALIETLLGEGRKSWQAHSIELQYASVVDTFADSQSISPLLDALRTIGMKVEAALEIPQSLLDGHGIEHLVSGTLGNARLVIQSQGDRGLHSVVVEISDQAELASHNGSTAYIMLAEKLFSGRAGINHLGAFVSHSLSSRKPGESKALAALLATSLADYLAE